MSDYSIESAVERIDNPQTKKYFEEVLSSYQAGNYRSAVVMLWSVIICDLVYKLQHLRDVDNDNVAKEILDDVENQQKTQPNNPNWENHLLNLVKSKTELLDTADFTNLSSIQQIRHLSAHPVLNNTDLLFTPYKEQVRSFIRITLESVITKPPVFLRKVVEEFVTDIASKKEILLDDISLKRYIESKYFKRLRPATENQLFRSLWKFVFYLENDDTNENREINYKCLRILYNRRPNELRTVIRENQDFFGKLGSELSLTYLIQFMSENPVLFILLTDDAKVLIENYSNSSLDRFAISIFLAENLNNHFNKILQKVLDLETTSIYGDNNISQNTWEILLKLAHENDCDSLLKLIAIYLYSKCSNFNSADAYFVRFIKPIMNQFTEEELIKLITLAENNSQVWSRSSAIHNHSELIKVCEDKLPKNFDKTEYPNFFRFERYFKKIEDDIPF